MEQKYFARRFSDLIVYQRACEISSNLFKLSRRFPREEMFALTDQIRRSSRSIGAQISEAWAKRKYKKAFLSKLTDADGEQLETQHWVGVAADCGYLTSEETNSLITSLEEVGGMLRGVMEKVELFLIRDNHRIQEKADASEED
ncbi:MAG: four helix bundle protein [Chthoniobacterales bacterium]